MERQIKFRAFCKLSKRMFDVGLICASLEFVSEIGDSISYYPFDNISLLQSTGLSDKHGDEIYEGDIIGTENAGYYAVEFRNGCFSYDSPVAFVPLYLFPIHDCEIIGNVHKKPEKIQPTKMMCKINYRSK